MPEQNDIRLDYDDMFIASRAATEEQLANADYIYGLVKKYVDGRIKDNQEVSDNPVTKQ